LDSRSDDTLGEQSRNGDMNAFGELFRRYYNPFLYRFRRFLADNEVVEDVIQEIFLRILDKIRYFDKGKGAFKGWAWKIANRTVLNYLDAELRRRRALETLSKKGIAEKSGSHNPGTLHSIRAAIDKLPKPEKTYFIEHHLQHLTYDEICDAHDLTKNQLKSRLRRARALIRSELEGQI